MIGLFNFDWMDDLAGYVMWQKLRHGPQFAYWLVDWVGRMRDPRGRKNNWKPTRVHISEITGDFVLF